MSQTYVDLDLHVEKLREGFHIHASIGGRTASSQFEEPFTKGELEAFRDADEARFVREIGPQATISVSTKHLGRELYNKVFAGRVGALLAEDLPGPRLGIRLRVRSDSPEVLRWPWELLRDKVDFLALSFDTPIIRHLEHPCPPVRTPWPLRVLVVVASPVGTTPLDTEKELAEIRRALRWPVLLGMVKIEKLSPPTLPALDLLLDKKNFHVLHFIGHGKLDRARGGVLLFEDHDRQQDPVTGTQLGAVLKGKQSLRLAVLNSCESSGGGSGDELFSGVAEGLAARGVPAVVAMQFPIEDRKAITFSYWFYWALAKGWRIEWAVTRARIALRAAGSGFDWSVPVLHLSANDGHLFRWRLSWPAVVSSISALLLGVCGWLAIPRNLQIMEPSDRMSPPPRYCRHSAALPDLNFILVYPGTFNMGSEAGEDDEKPVHQVTITKPFCLAERELTQKEWETIQGHGSIRTEWRGNSLPVSKVSYDEVQEFSRKLNEREEWAAFRLPTEAEWEYVASAPGTIHGNCHGESEPVPVGSFPANALGFHDLIGNVWEMTGDWYGPYPNGPVVDPKGPEVGEQRAVRGGNFDSAEKHCRPTRRETRKPSSQFKNTGIRLVREIRSWSSPLKSP